MSSHKAQRGFTWLELLVVVGILAVLAGLLVPVVAPAWTPERPATCLSHLRQVGLAVSLYVEDEGSGGAVSSDQLSVTSRLPPTPNPSTGSGQAPQPLSLISHPSSLIPHPPALLLYFPDALPFACPTARLGQWGKPRRAGRDAPPLQTVAQASCPPLSQPPTNDKGSGFRVQGLEFSRRSAVSRRQVTPTSQPPIPNPQPSTLNPQPSILLRTVPTFRLLHSSHATSAAMVLTALEGWQGRAAPTNHSPPTTHHSPLTIPPVVLIGGLEAVMYHCDCANNRHFWNIGKGIAQWARLNGRALTAEEKCLRSGNAAERFLFADYQRAIEAGRAVIVTLSFDAGSEDGLQAAAASQQRVSVVGIGYTVEGSVTRNELRYYEPSLIPSTGSGQAPHPSSLILVVQLPDGLLDTPSPREAAAVAQLRSLLNDDPSTGSGQAPSGDAQRKRLRWDVLTTSVSNVVVTFVK